MTCDRSVVFSVRCLPNTVKWIINVYLRVVTCAEYRPLSDIITSMYLLDYRDGGNIIKGQVNIFKNYF